MADNTSLGKEPTPINKTESRFFYALVKDGNLYKAYDEGFVDHMITTDEGRQVLQFITSHNNEFIKVPSFARIKEELPDIQFEGHKDNLKETIHDLREERTITLTAQNTREQARILKLSQLGSITREQATLMIRKNAKTLSSKIDSMMSQAVDVDIISEDFHNNYKNLLEERKNAGGMLGYEYPWPSMNKSTKGMCDEQLIVVLARTGVGKTWCLMKCAAHAWQTHNMTTLVISNEISAMSMSDRFVSMCAHIPYSSVRSGNLEQDEKQRLEDLMQNLTNESSFIVTGSDGMTTGGIGAIEARVKRYGAKIVFIDGAYLLSDDLQGSSRTERAANIARGLKKLAKRLSIPIFISWQFNRGGSKDKGGSTEDVGLTDVLSQDSDIMFELKRTQDMELNKRTSIGSIKTRDCAPFDFLIQWDFDDMGFEEIEEEDFDETDIIEDDSIEDSYTQALFGEGGQVDF